MSKNKPKLMRAYCCANCRYYNGDNCIKHKIKTEPVIFCQDFEIKQQEVK